MYLGPGFAIVIQVIIGFLISIPLFGAIYWKRIKAWWKGRKDAKAK